MLGEALQRYIVSLDPALAHAGEEALLLGLLLHTLPEQDTATVPRETLLSFVRHGLYLRSHSPYCREVPEDIFLHHVLYPRINTEDLVDHRPFFHSLLAPVVAKLPAREAALAVNRWCAAQMTYVSSDDRTINPLTAYFSGRGRCGEESTFAVSALRSVGIPARQIYAPWWSHCDDNHAWVEVYVDGDWHFLGACEPEPILNRGWFTSAATRAMAAVSRNFFDDTREGLAGEQIIRREGSCLHYNQIARYAETVSITVTVTDPRHLPLQGARVTLSVINMAALCPIGELVTDSRGQITLETGLGSLILEARLGDRYALAHLRTDLETACTLVLSPGPRETALALDFTAPAATEKNKTTLTPEQQAEKEAVLAHAQQLRQARMDSYYLPEYDTASTWLREILRQAGANARVLWQFYVAAPDKGQAEALLKSLSPKDYLDVTGAVLWDQLPCRDPAPRLGFEMLSPWRGQLLAHLSSEQQAAFREEPRAIWPWVLEHFPRENRRLYPQLWLQPGAALTLGSADLRGQRLLAAAIARALDIPGVLSGVDGRTPWEEAPTGILNISLSEEMAYGRDWSLARWENGWESLRLSGEEEVLVLPRGMYLAITTNRLPNGNQLARLQIFSLEESRELTLSLRQAQPEQMLSRYPLGLPKHRPQLHVYLEPGTEPGAHVLNELLEYPGPLPVPIRLFSAHSRDPLIRRVLEAFPGTAWEAADLSAPELEALARSLYLEPGVWPLLVLTDGQTGYFGSCGYSVNSLPLALSLGKWLPSSP